MIDKNSNILIIGLGLIGGSYAKGLRKKGYNVHGYDIDESSMKFAEKSGYISYDNCELENKIVSADMIIFALYPHQIVYYVEKYKSFFKKDVLLSDVSGTKVNLLKRINEILGDNFTYISHHPMAGKEKSGILYADEGIFKKANFIITPSKEEKRIDDIVLIGKELEFKNIEILSPTQHDEMIGYLSQLTHAIAIGLMNARDCEHMYKYSGDSFNDLTRIASINDKLWVELFFENKKVLINEINQFIYSLEDIKLSLENNDKNKLSLLMKESTRRRKKFDK